MDLLHCLDSLFIAARISVLHLACTVSTAFINFISSELCGKVCICTFNSLFLMSEVMPSAYVSHCS